VYLKLYKFVTWFFGPLIELYLLKRKFTGKEDSDRFYERKGKTNFKRPAGKIVWFHAASVGESISIVPIIQHLKQQYKNLNFLVTTGTVTSSKILETRLPKGVIHQYVPIDRQVCVQSFLNHWQPDLALFVESELWPNLLLETQKTGCTLLQINARISAHSFSKWQKYPDIIQAMLNCFSLSIAQSEIDKERLEKLGANKTVCLGNLKFEAPTLPANPTETGKVLGMIGDRNVWLAASTHKGEEENIIAAHNILKQKFSNLLTIIVPRHANRGDDVAELLKTSNINFVRRSLDEDILPETEIYLADTMGELGVFYRLSGVVFMGGSLVPHGGQNPLEAARLECAILSGTYTNNFNRIYNEMAENNSVIIVKDVDDLANKITDIFVNSKLQKILSTNALEYIESKSGIIDAYIKELEPYIKPLTV
jgi:3-deoxy-D-manno-octulosonic-acid transferase